MTRASLLLSLLLALPLPLCAQELSPERALEIALAAEARRVALIARIAPAVASVFPAEQPGMGGGSGVIIDPRGYVLTNFHVSRTEPKLSVGLNDGRAHPARLLGIDPGGDIALLRLEGERAWPWVPLGVSDAARVGEPVFALGNPFLLAEDYSPTVTEGVLSGLHRYRDASGGTDLVYGDCLQIDASINPGNSGGPLFNARGELLGINGLGGFRPDRGRVNVGVGFAASIDQIKAFLWDLRACRQAQHGTMNATVRDVEGEDGERSRLVVDALMQESRAYQAGLRLGDEVTHFDGTRVTTQNQLLTLVSRLPSQRRIVLGVERPREDGRGVLRLDLSFRLEPLWSGPEQGKWRPDPQLLARETQELLGEHRATQAPRQWVLRETVTRRDGGTEPRVTRMHEGALRVETGAQGARHIELVVAGRGWQWQEGQEGREAQPTPLSPARRDELAGTAAVLDALATPRGEEGLTELVLAGGERLGGRQVATLRARDRAGRERLLYIDPDSARLAGMAFPRGPEGKARWIEETHRHEGGQLVAIERRDHRSGTLLERSEASRVREPHDAALFAPPEGGQ